MSPRPVGFYVHHHGSGHATRTRLLAERLPVTVPVHVFTSAPERFTDWERGIVHPLPLDTDPDRDPAADLLTGEVLHYAPVGVEGLRRRMARMAAWIGEHDPALFVVDLSVEVLLLARLCGVRTALVRLHGHREDPAHLTSFRLADTLIAPFPPALEDEHTQNWVREKTYYTGAISRYDHRREDRETCRRQLGLSTDDGIVTVVNGAGGGAQEISYWQTVAQTCPDWTFLLVGRVATTDTGVDNLRCIGCVPDTFPYLKAADVVVGSGGTNTMLEIGAARVPYISLPEPRPFDEQVCKMRALQRLGLTRSVPPGLPTDEWPGLLETAGEQSVEGWNEVFAWTPGNENILAATMK